MNKRYKSKDNYLIYNIYCKAVYICDIFQNNLMTEWTTCAFGTSSLCLSVWRLQPIAWWYKIISLQSIKLGSQKSVWTWNHCLRLSVNHVHVHSPNMLLLLRRQGTVAQRCIVCTCYRSNNNVGNTSTSIKKVQSIPSRVI